MMKERIEALDGLRGVAILLIVLYHAKLIAFGWIGVQIFFVISGYLITTTLLRDKGDRDLKAYLGRFYLRRIWRIFPLYYLYVLILYVADKTLHVSTIGKGSLTYLLTHTYNYARIISIDHHSEYYSHLWAVSVEWQFYLLWPFIIYYCPPRVLRQVVLVIIILTPLVRFVMTWMLADIFADRFLFGSVFYNGALFQVDAFACGASIACFELRRLKHARRYFFVAGAILVTSGFINNVILNQSVVNGFADTLTNIGYSTPELFVNRNLQHVWGYSLINFVVVLLLICVSNNHFQLLINSLTKYIGKLSYSVYIWHYPIYAVTLHMYGLKSRSLGWNWKGMVGLVLYLSAVALISSISYHLIERNTLRYKESCL